MIFIQLVSNIFLFFTGILGIVLNQRSILLILMLIGYPMISNIYYSFFYQPVNPRLGAEFIGFQNYIDTFKDVEFYKSLGITLL